MRNPMKAPTAKPSAPSPKAAESPPRFSESARLAPRSPARMAANSEPTSRRDPAGEGKSYGRGG